MDKWLEKIYREAERIDWASGYLYAEKVAKNNGDKMLRTKYLMRFYYRIKEWKHPCDMGQIRVDYRDGKEYIMFYNYTYEQYVWAETKGFTELLDNNYFLVRASNFLKDTLKQLEEKAVNSYIKK